MQARRNTRLAEIDVLGDESGRIRIQISGGKINQPGVLIMLLTGEYLTIDGSADLIAYMSPGIEFVDFKER